MAGLIAESACSARTGSVVCGASRDGAASSAAFDSVPPVQPAVRDRNNASATAAAGPLSLAAREHSIALDLFTSTIRAMGVPSVIVLCLNEHRTVPFGIAAQTLQGRFPAVTGHQTLVVEVRDAGHA